MKKSKRVIVFLSLISIVLSVFLVNSVQKQKKAEENYAYMLDEYYELQNQNLELNSFDYEAKQAAYYKWYNDLEDDKKELYDYAYDIGYEEGHEQGYEDGYDEGTNDSDLAGHKALIITSSLIFIAFLIITALYYFDKKNRRGD